MYFFGGGTGGKGCGTKFSHPPNSSTIWLQYILGVFPQSCIRWRLRFHSCSTILPFQRMQRMSRDSPEATDMSHVLPRSHAPNSPGLHLSTFTLYNLQNEWVRPGGQWGWRWRFRPCFSFFLLAQELWVHVLWILKISSSSIPANKKAPWRWSIHFDGIFYALVRSSSETERVTKVGFSCECSGDFFWMENLRLYSGYVSWHWEETWGNMWNLW